MMKFVLVLFVAILSLAAQTQTPPALTRPGQTQKKTSSDGSKADSVVRSPQAIAPANPNTASTWLVTVFTGALALLAALQFWAMHRQAEFMRKGLRISLRQARLSARNARISEAAAKSSEHSALAASETLNQIRENFRLEHRAWICPSIMADAPFLENSRRVYLKEGMATSFRVAVINTGNTPAMDVTLQCSYRTLPRNVDFSPKYPEAPQRIGVIHPGLQLPVESPLTEIATPAILNDYRSGEYILYFYGSITYKDVFEGSPVHTTTFCLKLVPDFTGFTDHSTYNVVT